MFHIKGRNRSRVFENRVLRRIYGPKREEVTRQRKLHSGELRDSTLRHMFKSHSIKED
jgi:hypothetical protein